VTPPAHGALSLTADGSFAYTPNADFSGIDTFTYRAYDGTDHSPAATVSITVAAPVVVTPVEPTPPVVVTPVEPTPPVVVTPVEPTPPVVATPTVIDQPVVRRKGKTRSHTTYSISGSVRLGSAITVQSASDAASATRTPVVLEIQVERYVRKHWRVYKRVHVVNPGSRYATLVRLPSGNYRARALVAGGSVPTAKSTTTKSFKVRTGK
jgi:hypothetical protein